MVLLMAKCTTKCDMKPRMPRSSRDYQTLVYFQSADVAAGTVPAESDWRDVTSGWVYMKQRGSKEVDFANRVDAAVDVIAWAPYSADLWRVQSTWRVRLPDAVHGNRTFELTGPPMNIEERDQEIEFRLTETTAR